MCRRAKKEEGLSIEKHVFSLSFVDEKNDESQINGILVLPDENPTTIQAQFQL